MQTRKNEELIFSKPGVLVKNTGDNPFERAFYSVSHIQHIEEFSDEDFLTLGGTSFPMVYPVARDAIKGSEEEGKIEFSSYGNEYILRNFIEEDSEWFTGFGLPLSPKMMEDIMAEDMKTSIDQSVEALTDESGTLVGILYSVTNLGTFSRIDGEWKLGSPEGAEPAEGVEEANVDFTSTPINYLKSAELVERFDKGEEITEEEIDKTYASSEDEDEDQD